MRGSARDLPSQRAPSYFSVGGNSAKAMRRLPLLNDASASIISYDKLSSSRYTTYSRKHMLHRETSARFEKSGLWLLAEFRLVLGNVRSDRRWNAARGKEVLVKQQTAPVMLIEEDSRRRRWWMFRDEVYWEEDGLTETEVKALALERITRKDRRISRAVAMMEQADTFTSAREPIPDDVRIFVWNRDGGRCTRCHSNERLEFDHVIPVALGGSNTARNLQLLCETCNREKGASLA